jgi:hypothetical protein
MCSGQIPAAQAAASTPRDGAMELQLAPGLLDRMATCARSDTAPPADVAQANAGAVTVKGDCEWPSGVKCHFHLGAEFVDSRAPRPKVGELHCIFPSTEPKSPRVFGTHFTCKSGSSVSREVHTGEACGAGLLSALATMMPACDARCCEAGTLTTTLEERRNSKTLDVRPDFRICAASAELDCGMLAGMTGRSANAPLFGAPVADGM